MKKLLVLTILLNLIMPSLVIAELNPLTKGADDEQPAAEDAASEEMPEETVSETPTEAEPKDVEIEDVLTEEPFPEEEATDNLPTPAETERDAEAEGPMKITIDAVIYVDYQFSQHLMPSKSSIT